MKKPQLTVVATTRDSLSVKSPPGKGLPNLRKCISAAHLTSSARCSSDGTVTVSVSPTSWEEVVADLRKQYSVCDPDNSLPLTRPRLGRPPKDTSEYTGHVTHDLLTDANRLLYDRRGVVMQCKETGVKAVLLGLIPTAKELCPVGVVTTTDGLKPFTSFLELRTHITSCVQERPPQPRRYAGWRMYDLELEDRNDVFYKLGTSCIDKGKYMELVQGYVELPSDVQLFASAPHRGTTAVLCARAIVTTVTLCAAAAVQPDWWFLVCPVQTAPTSGLYGDDPKVILRQSCYDTFSC